MAVQSSSKVQLVRAALPIFGRRGMKGASTREISRAAGKPMSAITYHFGCKKGLYLACAQHRADTIGGLIRSGAEDVPEPHGIVEARAILGRYIAVMTNVFVREEVTEFARFMVREQQEPTEAFDIIYGGFIGQLLTRMVGLMRVVAGAQANEAELRVRVIALMGQVIGFRIARAVTLRLTGWSDVGEAERSLIGRAIQTHLAAILDSLERGHRASRPIDLSKTGVDCR